MTRAFRHILLVTAMVVVIAQSPGRQAAADEPPARSVVVTLVTVPAYDLCSGVLGLHRGLVHARVDSGGEPANGEVLLAFYCPTTPNRDVSINSGRPRPRRFTGLWPGDRLAVRVSPCSGELPILGARSLPQGLAVLCVEEFERLHP